MTDDLSTKFAALTEGRPEPADPAAPIRLRIARRQRRRRSAAVVVATATATAAVLATGPMLGSIASSGAEPGVAGFAAPTPTPTTPTPTTPTPTTPTPTTPTPPLVDHTTVMPAPWSTERFTKMPDAAAYQPNAYYIAKGTVSTGAWAVLAFSAHGCMITDEGPANSFGRQYVCFDEWRPGQRSSFKTVQGHAKEKNASKIDATLVMGAVSADARTVQVKSGGKTYQADAVGTPASDRLRFFALVIPHKDVKVTSAIPLDAAGRPTGTPTGVPMDDRRCDAACATATPQG